MNGSATLIQFGQGPGFAELIHERIKQFKPQQKIVIFVEPYGSTLALINYGLDCGYNIIIFTANQDLCMVPSAILEKVNMSIEIDTADESLLNAVTDIIAQYCQVDAVIPGFEYFVPIAASLSQRLKLPAMLPENVALFRNKFLMKHHLSQAGVAVPPYELVRTMNELSAAIKKIGYPGVCKPIDAAGSVNVRKVLNKGQAFLAASRILYGNDVLWGHHLANMLLYEAYIEGKEYSLEGVIIKSQIYHLNLTEKIVADETDFVEIGHIANPPIAPAVKQEIEEYVSRSLQVLGANNCPFHAEIRLDQQGKPLLMEVAARLAGDKIGDLINLTMEANYYAAVYAAYFAHPLSPEVVRAFEQHHHAGIRFFYRPKVDCIQSVDGAEQLSASKENAVHLYYPVNAEIPAFPKALRRLGHVMLQDHDYQQLKLRLDAADRMMQFN